MKKKGWAFVNDLDILWDIALDDSEPTIDDTLDDTAVLPASDKPEEEVKAEEPKEPETPEPKVEEPVKPEEPKVNEEEPKKSEEGEDLDKWLDELLKNNVDVEAKVDEVQKAAEESWDENLIKLVDELQTSLADKNLTIEELKKQLEVSNNRYLSKFGEEEELSIYKNEIQKLQDNPRLMALVKFNGTDNEKVKPKLVRILSDMLYDLTGQDVSDLLDQKDKAWLSILDTPSSDTPPIQEMKKEEEKNMDYEESVNNILGL